MPTESVASDERRHTIRSVSLGTLLRLARWPFALLSLFVIPGVMGSATYGRFALFMPVYLLADMLTDIGVLQVFGRFVPGPATPETERRRVGLLHGFLATGVALTAVVCLLAIAYVQRFPSDSFPSEWLLPFCLLLIVTRIEGVLFSFLYGLNSIARYSAREALRSLLLFLGVTVFFLLFGLPGALWSLVVKEAVLALIAMRWTRRYLFQPFRPRWSEWKPYVRFGLGFYVPFLLFGLLQRSGALFISRISGLPEQVGFFDVANQFFLMGVGFLGVILITLLPSMSAFREAGDDETIHRWHGAVMPWFGAAVVLAFQALVWLGEPTLALFLGTEFLPVRNLALVATLAMAPGLIVYVGMNYAILDKQPMACARGILAGLVAMTLVCLALIPLFQAKGAMWGAVAGHTVSAVFFWLRYRQRFRIALKGYLPVLALGALFAPLALLHAPLPWSVAGFVVATGLFLALALALRVLDAGPLLQSAKKAWRHFRGRRFRAKRPDERG